MDILDSFNEDVRRAATRLAYGAEVDDPLLRAAGALYLGGFETAGPGHPQYSNGALRFAVYVAPQNVRGAS